MTNNVTLDQELELERWLRPFSPLTDFARTCKNQEGAEGGEASGAKTSGEDPTEAAKAEFLQAYGEDIPEEVQNKLWENHSKLEKENQETKAELAKLEKIAKGHQSRADQALATLQKHNLLPDGRTAEPSVQDQPIFKGIVQALQARGFTPEQAKNAAEVQMAMFEPMQQQILQNVAGYIQPALNTVGNIQADRLLQQVQGSDQSGLYSDPEIAASVKNSLAQIVQTGGDFNNDSINWLFQAEIGKRYATNKLPSQNQNSNVTNQQQNPMQSGGWNPQMNINTRPAFPVNTGAGQFNQQQNQAPQARTADVANTLAKFLPHLFKGTSKDPQAQNQRGGRK